MAFADKTGIVIAGGFKLQAPSPIDARFFVDTLVERDELVTIGAVYEGLTVYCKEDTTFYIYYGVEAGWGAVTYKDVPTIDSIPESDIEEVCV